MKRLKDDSLERRNTDNKLGQGLAVDYSFCVEAEGTAVGEQKSGAPEILLNEISERCSRRQASEQFPDLLQEGKES